MQGDNDGLASFWMPFTANRAYKAHPRQIVSASGMHYQSGDGRTILDGTAGLWCSNAGHCRTEIAAAMARAAATLDFAPTFQLGHPAAFELAQRLAALMPPGLDRIFFTNSGSESVDTALKIALAVQRARGQGTRTRLIGRERGYHGVGFGGISVGGIVGNRRAFALLPGADHLRHTHDPARNAFSRGFPPHGAELADDLQRLVDLHGAETIAAVIVEPMAGSTGVLVPPVGYLERLRTICDRNGILLIFDEVITAFGRVGAATAAQAWGVTPDILTMAKGLTNAAVPMGAVAVKRELHDAVIESAPGGIELAHGYTYSGHPLACAAGLAALDLYAREGLFERAAELAPYWEAAAHGLRGRRHIVDIRTIGLVAGIELEPRPGAPTARAMELFHRAFDAGLLVRATGDIIALSPPLIVEKAQIDQMFGMLGELLDTIA
ncbi:MULTISPECIES: aspartate aminotransferase family protein [Sphingopyxis]|jgi:beta-alanine--pyruvate transaminase|uniref:aspartate aminotransferase family protein n=1 Tax=Sphingopyxis TaxID=165697 RepID=UPI00086DB369|nr:MULTISPECIES: aspartate aminotransferase family protein [Sphingopyxis]APW72483.1 aspartate aminotransferase family protein [Sphingopyxis granuli]AVA14055.1 aspartate aminotransferase family protein [Sphingopyxis sp. MG]ODU27822.1 MAG: omega amino acid--pyruvate aminotransferase [Sphingopyxis sp. SCN 67-31]